MAIAARTIDQKPFNSPELAERLFSEHRGLVYKVVQTMRLGKLMEFDDAISEGMIGLLYAARHFDPGRGSGFSTYAAKRIHGQVIDGLRRYNGVRRNLPEDFSGPRSRVVSLFNDTTALSIDAPVSDDAESSNFEAFVADSDPNVTEVVFTRLGLTDDQMRHVWISSEIRRFLPRLSAKERFVIEQYYWHGHPFHLIGQAMGFTESRACQLHVSACNKIRILMEGGKLRRRTYKTKSCSLRPQWLKRLAELTGQSQSGLCRISAAQYRVVRWLAAQPHGSYSPGGEVLAKAAKSIGLSAGCLNMLILELSAAGWVDRQVDHNFKTTGLALSKAAKSRPRFSCD